MKVVVTDYTFDSLDTENAVLTPLGHTVVGRRCKTPEELTGTSSPTPTPSSRTRTHARSSRRSPRP